MWKDDSHISRAVQTLSRLLGRQLELTEGGESEDIFTVRASTPPRLAVRTTDNRPFTLPERQSIGEVLEVFNSELAARLECQALDQRLRLLERENVDLSMKNRALTEASSRDALTGLFNRWYVLDKIEEELSRAWRHGSTVSVLMLDIDHFKRINDSYGHTVGDHVLQAIGSVLRDSCRIYDIPGRYGGEEFCLMLPETKLENTAPVAERIRRRVESTPFVSGNVEVRVTTSIGVAGLENIPEEGLFGATSLIERADRALYCAKNLGRNRVEFWSAGLGRTSAVAH